MLVSELSDSQMKISEAALRHLYLVERKTDYQIACLLGCKKHSVYRARKRFGIPAYDRWERHQCEPTDRQVEILFASILGDGSISNGVKGKGLCQSYFEEKHCIKQEDYVFWKYKELQNLCVSPPTNIKNGNIRQWRIRTFHHPYFSQLRSRFYPNGTKVVDLAALERIGPLGCAVWLMDDGTMPKVSNHLKFCTCSYTENEHQMLIDWLWRKFAVKSQMKVYSGYRFLVIDIESRKKLIDAIKDHVIDSMKYKATFREYHTWTNT